MPIFITEHTMKKNTRQCNTCNKTYTSYGKKFCSRQCQPTWNKGLKGINMGENNPYWKGGIGSINLAIRRSLDYKLWREAVFKRDNYTCVLCGDNKGGNLEADHIIPFCKLYLEESLQNLLWDVGNGRTLCQDCHKRTDTYGIKANNYQLTLSK